MGSGFTLFNSGTIAGGTGSAGGGRYNSIGGSGGGGVGLISTGGSTITTAGTISGGLANGGSSGSAQADSVALSGGGNTLILENGYVFNGNVVSTSGTTNGGDTLELGGVPAVRSIPAPSDQQLHFKDLPTM